MSVKLKAAICGLILTIAVVYLFIEVGSESTFIAFTIKDYPTMAKPSFWPRIMLIGLLVSTLLKLFLAVRETDKPQLGKTISETSLIKHILLPKVLISVFIVTLYCYLSQYLGFAFVTMVFAAVYMRFMGMKRLTVLTSVPIISTLCILLVFWRFLYVAVPKGQGIFLTFSNLIMGIIRFGMK